MKQNAITQAIGALKLVPIFVNNPTIDLDAQTAKQAAVIHGSPCRTRGIIQT